MSDSLLVIRHPASEVFVQFVKRQTASSYVLGFGFPDAGWSRAYFDAVARAVTDAGLNHEIVSTGDAAVPRFLEVEIGPDEPDQAVRLANLAFDAMGVDRSTFVATMEGELDVTASLLDAREVLTRGRRTDEKV